MKILSLDVGIINLAFCILDSDFNIHNWEVITLCNKTEVENTRDMIIQFDSKPFLLDSDLILVEKQPRCNPKMKVMAEAIRTYFIIRSYDKGKKIPIINYSPRHKLNCYEGETPVYNVGEYLKRKKISVFHCEKLIENQSPEIKAIFLQNRKKKDDLADCYLQAYSYIKFKNTIIPRCPTKKQIKFSKYSKPNLKYLLKEELKKHQIPTETTETPTDPLDLDPLDLVIKNWLEQKEISKSYKRLYRGDFEKLKKELI
jgi:hypothetical protein